MVSPLIGITICILTCVELFFIDSVVCKSQIREKLAFTRIIDLISTQRPGTYLKITSETSALHISKKFLLNNIEDVSKLVYTYSTFKTLPRQIPAIN